jgi:hypothetical protein
MYEYYTEGTCSTKINFDIKDGKLSGVIYENGKVQFPLESFDLPPDQ